MPQPEKVLPKYFTIDITSKCNLQCAFCPEGQHINPQPSQSMRYDDFLKFAPDVLSYARSVSLTNWSEPFLHPQLCDFVKYIKSCNPEIYVSFSSNGNAGKINQELILQLIHAGLNRLEISISGTEQSVYERYHRGGNLEHVKRALKAITSAKMEAGSSLPHVCINYLTWPYNVISRKKLLHWLDQVLGASLAGYINEVRLIRGTIFGELHHNEKDLNDFTGLWRSSIIKLSFKPRCRFVFNHLVIRADGAVFPCCVIQYADKFSIGNIYRDDVKTIWKKNSGFRADFINGSSELCEHCRFYHGVFFRPQKDVLMLNIKLFYQIILHYLYTLDKKLFKNYFFKNFWIKTLVD